MKKRHISLALSIVMIISAIIVPMTSVSAETPVEKTVKPAWFDPAEAMSWYTWDARIVGSWYASLNLSEGWEFQWVPGNDWLSDNVIGIGAGTGCDGSTVRYQGPTEYDIDLDEIPYLNFNINTSFINSTIMLRFFSGGEQVLVPVAVVNNGNSSVSVDLRDVSELTPYLNSGNSICLQGVYFTSKSKDAYTGDTMKITNFVFSSQPAQSRYNVNWFDASNDSSYWDYNSSSGQTNSDGPYLINHLDNNVWQYFYRWGNGTAKLNTMVKAVTQNASQLNMLNITVECSKSINLLLKMTTTNDSGVGVSTGYISIAQLDAGKHDLTIDLMDNADFRAMLDLKGNYTLAGICFTLGGYAYGDYVNISNTYFYNSYTKPVLESSNLQSDSIIKGSKALSFNASASLQENHGTLAYQWYDNGKAINGAISGTYDFTPTAGYHKIYCKVYAAPYSGAVGAIPAVYSDTAEFGVYNLGDITFTGNIDSQDLIMLRKNLIGQNTLDNLQTLAADTDEDGTITLKDLVRIKKLAITE